MTIPATRGDCPERRPCPHVTCRYQLPGGACALDKADGGPSSYEEIGALLGVTRERVRQIEADATRKLLRLFGRERLTEILTRPAPAEVHLLLRIAREDGEEDTMARRGNIRARTLIPGSIPARIVEHLREHGATARGELWRALGLRSADLLNNAINRLKQLGLVEGGGSRHAPEPYRLTGKSLAPARPKAARAAAPVEERADTRYAAPVGRRFGRLVVVGDAPPRTQSGRTRPYWACVCDCGQTKEIYLHSLLGERPTLSCGCVHRERVERMKQERLERLERIGRRQAS